MKSPNIYTLDYLQSDNIQSVTTLHNGKWIPVRPIGLNSLKQRMRCAWLVFTGKADAFIWPEDINK